MSDHQVKTFTGGQAMTLHTVAAVVAVTSYVALWVITLWMAQK